MTTVTVSQLQKNIGMLRKTTDAFQVIDGKTGTVLCTIKPVHKKNKTLPQKEEHIRNQLKGYSLWKPGMPKVSQLTDDQLRDLRRDAKAKHLDQKYGL